MSRAPYYFILSGLLLVSSQAFAGVQVIGTTATQAVIAYDAPSGSSCRMEVSESPSYSPPAADVDPKLFAGADQDSRQGVLANRMQRVFVVGRHGMNANSANDFVAADGRRHSRALQAGTQHYFRVTCGTSVTTGTFTTGVATQGNTYGEPAPVDASRPGFYNWPDMDPTDRSERVIDPATGALIRKIGVPADTAPNKSSWPDSGAYSLCSSVPMPSGGDTYYTCYVPSTYAGTLVSINTRTGDAIPLSSMVVPYRAIGNESTMPCSSVVFDGTVGTQFYCISSFNGKAALLMGDWTGPINTPSSGFTGTSPNGLLRWSNLTPVPNNLTNLMAGFDPLYTSAQQANVPYFIFAGQQRGKLVMRLSAAQDASGWVVVFDPGNKQPVGAGGTGGIVAAMPVWNSPAGRWCGLHAVIGNGDTRWISATVNNLGSYSVAYLGGPYRVFASGPTGGAIGTSDTTFTISANNGSYEPLDPSPVEPGGYLMDAQPGDLFFLDKNANGVFNAGTDEYVELVSKNAVTHAWTVRRANQMASSPFYTGTGLSFWSTSTISASAGTSLYAACRTQSLSIQASPSLWWDFEADPHGRNAAMPAADGNRSSQVIEHTHTGAHEAMRYDQKVMADWGCFSSSDTCWTAWTLTGGVPGLYTLGAPTKATARPAFEGAYPPGGSNVFQQHPSYSQVNAPAEEKKWLLDRMPLVWGTTTYGVSQLVSGTTGVYKVSNTTLHRDKLATLASCGTKILRDISSAATGVQISDGTPYTYCVARKAGECQPDSTPGDAFVSCPGANYRLGTDAATTVQCASSTLADDKSVDICMGDVWPYAQSVVQAGFSTSLSNGELNRVITQGFSAYHEPGSLYENAMATPDGGWAMFSSSVTGSRLGYLARIAPQPWGQAATRHDGFVPVTLNVAPPTGLAGVQNAIVEFGYLENGGPTDFFCTSRRETCVKGSQAGNSFSWASDGDAGQPCATGCSMTLPVVPDRVAYFRVKYRDSAGTVLAIGETGVAGESGTALLKSQGAVQVSPASSTLGLGQTLQLELTDTLGPVPAVWSVNPPVGTISATGLYTAPAAPPSSLNVVITATDANNSSRVATATIILTIPAPVLTGLSPATGMQGTNVTVTLTGSNFLSGAVVSAANLGARVSNVTVAGLNRITATLEVSANAPAGPANITVTTTGGTSAAAVFTVTVQPPVLTAISPATGGQGSSVPVTLTGTNFTTATEVKTSSAGILVSDVNVVSSTEITATLGIAGNAALGTANVTVTTAGGTSGPVAFTTTAPTTIVAQAIRINAGGAAATAAGVSWAADSGFTGGLLASTAAEAGVPSIYQTVRYGDSFSYSFSVPNGSYTVNLKFAEVSLNKTAGYRVFNVTLNGIRVLTNFDILAATGQRMVPIEKMFPVTATAGKIKIEFSKGTANLPMINAIEILPFSISPLSATVMAGATAQFSASVPVTWSVSPVVGSISTAGVYTAPASVASAQTVVVTAARTADPNQRVSIPVTVQAQTGQFSAVRINAGSGAYTDSQGRVWAADSGYTDGLPWATTLGVSGTTMSPVLQTVRYGDSFRYSFAVPNGSYTVNLYFAEVSQSGVGQRIFSTSINGTTVLSNFDVYAQAGGPLKAITRSFPVTVSNGVVQIQFSKGAANSPMVSAIEIY